MSSPKIAGLQVTGDLFERVPDVILVFEQLRVSRVFEIEKIGGRKHFSSEDGESPSELLAEIPGNRLLACSCRQPCRQHSFGRSVRREINIPVSASCRDLQAGSLCSPDHVAPRGVSFWPSFVSRTSQPSAEIRSRSSSLRFQFFSRLAFSRSFVSCSISAGGPWVI